MNELSDIVLSCAGLVRSYAQGNQALRVINGLELELGRGEKLAITGSSGSGKTTLLNLLGGIDHPDSGSVTVLGKSLGEMSGRQLDELRNRHLGFVYQFHHLLGEFSARENVAMPLIIARYDFAEALSRADSMLARVGLAGRASHRPSELSGGERQRVAIARALINEPACVLMDEPTGNLDRHTAHAVQDLLLELNERTGVSMVMVTHDLELAGRMDRTLRLEDGRLKDGAA